MATIQQSIALTDGVSPVFNRMAQAAEKTIGRFEKAADAADRVNKTIADTSISRHVENIGTAANSTLPGFNAISNKISEIKNKMSDIGSGGFDKIKGALSGMAGQFAIGSLVAGGIASIAALLSGLPGKLAALSDEYSGIQARLKLITNSQSEAAALNDQIYYSALRARGSYSGMADAISKIGLTAKSAFPDPQEIVPFVEGIQKLFTIGGTGIEQQKDAMLQLTQALGSGKLQGDEFRSIAEAAPMIEQMVSKYMGVTQGELKQLSSDGAITADIIKNAILGNIDEINEKFKTMPLTWGQIWQNMKTEAFRAFTPVFEQISALANSPAIAAFGNGFSVVVNIAAIALAGIINNLFWLGSVAEEVGSYISGWLMAGFIILADAAEWAVSLAIAYLYMYAMGWLAVNGQMLISAGIQALVTAYTWMQNAAMIALNAELLISYIRMGIVTAATFIWTMATQGLTAAMRILNLTMLLNPIGLIIGLVLIVIGVFIAWAIHTEGLRNVIAGAFSAMAGIAAEAINFMIDRINNLIGLLNKAASAINSVFGTNIGTVGEITWRADKAQWQKGANDFVQNFSVSDIMGSISKPEMPQPSASDLSGYGTDMNPDDIANNTKDTADNTGNIKDALDITDEDLKYLRDAAEQEAINKYTTAEVKIDMGGVHNSVNGDTDLDGMMRYMNDSLIEAMSAGAEAVHP